MYIYDFWQLVFYCLLVFFLFCIALATFFFRFSFILLFFLCSVLPNLSAYSFAKSVGCNGLQMWSGDLRSVGVTEENADDRGKWTLTI